jgi:excisionase family DNA binding protein
VEEDANTTSQAARILRVTDRAVRKMIDRGELEAAQDERGRHLILQRAVNAMLEERRGSSAGDVEGPSELPPQELPEPQRIPRRGGGSSGLRGLRIRSSGAG